MKKKLFILLFLFIVLPCFPKEIIVGVINDDTHFFEHNHNDSPMKRQKTAIINRVKKEIEKKFKNFKITIRYIDYDNNSLSSAPNAISEQIKKFKPDIIFGPFLDKSFYFLKETIEKSDIPFIAYNHTSKLKNLKNYYTPFEWDRTSVELILEKVKKMLNKEKPKIGAFVQLTDEHSSDTYETLKGILGDELLAVKLVHTKLGEHWNYKNKLDIEIEKMSKFSPDIIFNSNSNDIEGLAPHLIIKMIEKGYDGIFVDTGTWPCSKTFFERSKDYLKNMTKPSIGLTVRQKKCYMDLKKDEKEFRNALIENDDKYYSMSGLLYKTLSHVLNIVFKSNLPINANNIHKIIKKNPYFKGFSDESYNLYKTKDSPEFLSIYKYQFKKYLTIEKVSM